jgi:DNA-binding transcriptional ArsR family regulator
VKPGEGHNAKTAGTFEIESLDERKTMLMDNIANLPGIRYRELLKLSGFSNGVLFYHLTGLEEAGLVRVERKRAKNYKILSKQYLRNRISHSLMSKAPALREIILFILDNHQGTLSDIANYTGKSISTVSSHLGKLKQEEIISTRRSGQGFFSAWLILN